MAAGIGRRAALVLAAAALAAPGAARAQTQTNPTDLAETPGTNAPARLRSGDVFAGALFTVGRKDSGKLEEYRDLDNGPTGGFHLNLRNPDGTLELGGLAERASRADQAYGLGVWRPGLFRADLFYRGIPHEFSKDARSIHVPRGDSELVVDDATQAAIQAAAPTPGAPATAQAAALAAALGGARPVPLRFQTHTGGAALGFRAQPGLDVDLGWRFQRRDGTRPWGLGFGSPGNNFAAIAAPLQDWMHEVTGGAGLSREKWSVRLGYNGSFYQQDIPALVVDNPLVANDSPVAGTSQGRIQQWPSNQAHQLSLEGGATLPTSFPLRFVGALGYGMRFQDEAFLPHTINRALQGSPALALPRASLDGRVDTLLATARLAGRPAPKVDATASYRFFDYIARTPILDFPAHVVNDRTLVAEERSTTPVDYRRHDAALGAGWRLLPKLTARAGLAWERWDRNRFREVTRTDEYTARAGVDVRASPRLQLRGGYRFALKDGAAYNTFAHLAHTVPEAEVDQAAPQSQSRLLRKYDQADRYVHRADVYGSWLASDALQLGASGTYSVADYHRTTLGLVNRHAWGAGVDAGWTVSERLSLNAFYGFEWARRDQWSRWRPRTFTPPIIVTDDPVNNWFTRNIDLSNTFGVNADVVVVPGRLEAQLAYLLHDGAARTLGESIPGTTSPPNDGGNAPDYPDLRELRHATRVGARVFLPAGFQLRAAWRWEFMDLDDFRTEPLEPYMPQSNISGSGTVSPSLDVFLGDRLGDYNVHIFEILLAYEL